MSNFLGFFSFFDVPNLYACINSKFLDVFYIGPGDLYESGFNKLSSILAVFPIVVWYILLLVSLISGYYFTPGLSAPYFWPSSRLSRYIFL